MSERISVSLLVLVAVVALMVKNTSVSRDRIVPPEQVRNTQPLSMVVVTGAAVNLRAGPSLSHAVAAKRVSGDELEMIGSQGDWYNVRALGQSLWISKLYASPASDCPSNRTVAPDGLPRQLIGEWKGEVGSQKATLVLYAQGGGVCGYIIYGNVKEALTVSASGANSVTLSGHRFEHLEGGSGGFSLDSFSAEYDRSSGRLSGSYIDAGGRQGRWFAERGVEARASRPNRLPGVRVGVRRRARSGDTVLPSQLPSGDGRVQVQREVGRRRESRVESFPVSSEQPLPEARRTRIGSALFMKGTDTDGVFEAAYRTMIDVGYSVVEASPASGELRGFRRYRGSATQTWVMSVKDGHEGIVSLIMERGTTGESPLDDHVILLKYIVGGLRGVSRDEVFLNVDGDQRLLSEW